MNLGSLVADGALWISIPIAMLAGLVSFLSPCILPLVPGYLGFIGGAVTPRPRVPQLARASDAGATTRSAVRERGLQGTGETPGRGRLAGGVLLFIAGFTVVFMTMNIFSGTVGRFFLQYSDLITRVMGVVIILMGLVFIGLFGFAQRTFHPEVRSNIGLIGAPLLGLALGLGWAPCLSPTLTAIVSVSWNLGDPVRGGILGLAYSLGLGIPFILIALGFGWATRSVAFLRRHIRIVNLIGGAVLVVLGVLMVLGVWGSLMTQLQGVVSGVPIPFGL